MPTQEKKRLRTGEMKWKEMKRLASEARKLRKLSTRFSNNGQVLN